MHLLICFDHQHHCLYDERVYSPWVASVSFQSLSSLSPAVECADPLPGSTVNTQAPTDEALHLVATMTAANTQVTK